jgi:hypothetical protein
MIIITFYIYTMKAILLKTLKYLSLPFLIVCIHWICIIIYSNYCVPSNLYEVFTTMIAAGSPICSALLTIAEKTSSLYISTWAFFGIYIISLFTDFTKWITNS